MFKGFLKLKSLESSLEALNEDLQHSPHFLNATFWRADLFRATDSTTFKLIKFCFEMDFVDLKKVFVRFAALLQTSVCRNIVAVIGVVGVVALA